MSGAPRAPRKGVVVIGGVAAAIALAVPVIQHFEGLRQTGYGDVVGVATSCFGHTGPDAVVGRRYSMAECEGQLARDLERTSDGIADCIKVPVPANSYAAFVSFAFNVGPAAFCRSTVVKRLNAGDLRGACAGLSAWVYAGGKKWPGLVRRRAAERALCEEGL